ncbi:MAG: Serine/threonine-protein kinase StkP [Chlamydiae bacterium]|nr:Serine/threonine-protein kinase StkP [Chlamydiota bacterium]
MSHIVSPRIEMTDQLNDLSTHLEQLESALETLKISANIMTSESELNQAIVSDLVQIQLNCLKRQEPLTTLKTLCKQEVKTARDLYWKHLATLDVEESKFKENWKSKTLEHLILNGLQKDKDIPLTINLLKGKQEEIAIQENLNIEEIELEASIKQQVQKHQEQKETYQNQIKAGIKVEDVFAAAQVGDLDFIQKKVPKIFGKEKFFNQKDSRGYTMLHIAAYSSKLNVVQYLLTNRANPDCEDAHKNKSLHWAAAIGAHQVTLTLLQNKADVNGKGEYDRTPLHRSVYNGHEILTSTLLNHGADINAQTNVEGHSITPIFEAITRDNVSMVKLLLQNQDLDLTVRDASNSLPLDLANHGNPKILSLLKQHLEVEEESKSQEKAESSSEDAVEGSKKAEQIPLDEIEQGDKLGSGGFADVYRGTWMGKEIAIKVLKCPPQGGDEEIIEELENEAEIMSQLNHPNIIRFYGVVENTHNFVLGFMEQGSLFDLIRTKKTQNWDWTKLLQVGKDMSRGVRFLHSKKIVHRDLKSPNVLLDKEGTAVLSDFGLSKIRAHTMTLTGSQGSPAWMAPEQLLGEEYGEHVDIYSLGLILWELLEGKRPYEGKEMGQIIAQAFKGKTGEKIDKEKTPPTLVTLLEESWRKDPLKRPSAVQFLETLETLKADELDHFPRV